MLGRQLLVWYPASGTWKYLDRSEIPSPAPCVFVAAEPCTVLGIDPETTPTTIAERAEAAGGEWQERISEIDVPSNLRRWMTATVAEAVSILKVDCRGYRSFASAFGERIKLPTERSIQRVLIKALFNQYPQLGSKNALQQIRGGALMGSALMAALALTIGALAIPVGGTAILGVTLFATTLAASWGPFAFIPATIVSVLGILATTYYRRHHSMFTDLSHVLRDQIMHIHAVAMLVVDDCLLGAYRKHTEEPGSCKLDAREIQEAVHERVRRVVDGATTRAIERLEALRSHTKGDNRCTFNDFCAWLGNRMDILSPLFNETLATEVLALVEALPPRQLEGGGHGSKGKDE